MIPKEIFFSLKSHENAVEGDVRLDLRTWKNYTETLTRVVLAPLACGHSKAQGYLIWGKSFSNPETLALIQFEHRGCLVSAAVRHPQPPADLDEIVADRGDGPDDSDGWRLLGDAVLVQ